MLDGARRLVEAGGLGALSMRDLAAEADVSVRTIYNVLGDKDGVIAALVQESFDAIDVRLATSEATDPLERVWEAVATSVEAYSESVPRPIIAAIVTDLDLNAAIAPRWRARETVLHAIEAAAAAGAIRDDLTPARLLEQAGPAHAHRLHQWAVGAIDLAELRAGVLYAYDVSLLAVARPRARSRILDHLAALEPLVPPLIVGGPSTAPAHGDS